jgi:hypothetical protein
MRRRVPVLIALSLVLLLVAFLLVLLITIIARASLR